MLPDRDPAYKIQPSPNGSESNAERESHHVALWRCCAGGGAGWCDVEAPDPEGQIHRDTQGLIVTEVAVVPPQVKPGDSVRVHVTMRPNERLEAHWNNEAQPLTMWIDAPPGWQVQQRLLMAPQGQKPETAEPRHFEFEVRAAADARATTTLSAYALYYVCEGVGGTCQFLRQDIPVTVKVHDGRSSRASQM